MVGERPVRQRENVASQRQKGGPEGDSMRGPELIAREGTATGGDMVKEREHRESCERERERERERGEKDWVKVEREERGETKRGRTKRPGGFVCWHSQPEVLLLFSL